MPRGIYKNPIERAKRISETCKKRGIGKWMIGRKLSEKTKEKIRKNSARYWLGKKRGKQSKEWIKKRTDKIRGMKRKPDFIKWLSENNPNKGKFGREHPCWKENKKTPLHRAIRMTFKYRKWHSDIFTRDNFTCVLCGKRGGELNADHYPKMFIEIINEYKIKTLDEAIACEELWNLDNGRTLCVPCHRKTFTYLKKIK